MTRSKTATLWELDCILHRATKLTDRNFTIFPPSDSEGNLLLDETIEYYKKEIIKTITKSKRRNHNENQSHTSHLSKRKLGKDRV